MQLTIIVCVSFVGVHGLARIVPMDSMHLKKGFRKVYKELIYIKSMYIIF
jgi:hypothetical protein